MKLEHKIKWHRMCWKAHTKLMLFFKWLYEFHKSGREKHAGIEYNLQLELDDL